MKVAYKFGFKFVKISIAKRNTVKKNRRAKWKRDRKKKTTWKKQETSTETGIVDSESFQTSMFFPDVNSFEQNHESSFKFEIDNVQCPTEFHIFRKSLLYFFNNEIADFGINESARDKVLNRTHLQ
jgi:hypothetical protein